MVLSEREVAQALPATISNEIHTKIRMRPSSADTHMCISPGGIQVCL